MRRLCFSLAAAVACAASAAAQPEWVPNNGKIIIPLTLSPAAPAKPLSAAYLLPEYSESIPGNRVQMFLRCFMEQDRFFGKEEFEKRQKWNAMPLADLPLAELKGYGQRLVERDLYDAARMLDADWQLWYFLRRDGIGTLLPDLQKMRELADVLKTRVRADIAAGDHAGALNTLKIMFGLARTTESHPCNIGHLVGVAIATIGLNALDELVQSPGCPNLYWSLSDLPSPFIDLRPAIQGERAMTVQYFDALLNASGPLSEDQLTRLVREFSVLSLVAGGMEGQPKRWLEPRLQYAAWAADAKRVAAARARLIETGFDPRIPKDIYREYGIENKWPVVVAKKADIVKNMPPLQVVLTDDVLQYHVLRDELFKWMPLPFPLASAGIKDAETQFAKVREELILAPSLIPTVVKVRTAQARLEQRIALARIIEAVRLHAHTAGKLPESLTDIRVPVPIDPVSGKAFEYSMNDGVATLHGANPIPGNPQTNRYYEIRLRK